MDAERTLRNFARDANVSRISAHGLTGPNMALNALNKLLVSLPVRCRYKLALDKYVPSPYLLSVVRSFKFTSVARLQRSLIRHQPTELLDMIVEHVDPKLDALALALLNGSMHGIFFLHHFGNRTIRDKLKT